MEMDAFMSDPFDEDALYHCKCGNWHRKAESFWPPCERTFIPKDAEFKLGPNRVFVFGSNLAGIHGAGAAYEARMKYGAILGKWEGLAGNSYAIPTKNGLLSTLPLSEIQKYIDRFIGAANIRPDLQFFVTRIGCGLAGYTDYDIAPLFKDAPANCELPPGWRGFEEEYGVIMPTRL